ncbi:MAG: Ger(x)C family spore germination protein [Eubacteriaceae bacterium]|nr:Ger(x)C family spore germination protein [Eubacteriaceae bacterium]
MKRVLACLASALALFCMSGCWSSVELNDISIVLGIGIDASDSNLGVYDVYYQFPKSKLLAEASAGEEAYITTIAHPRGIAEALYENSAMSTRQILLKNNLVIVVGRGQAEKGIAEIIDYFLRSSQNRLNTSLIISQTSAVDLLASNAGIEAVPAIMLHKTLAAQEAGGLASSATLNEYAIALVSQTKNPTLPLMAAGQSSSGVENTASFIGMAVFEGNKMVGILDQNQTKIMQMLTASPHRHRSHFISRPARGQELELSCDSIASKLTVGFGSSGRPFANYDIAIDCHFDRISNAAGMSKAQLVEACRIEIEKEVGSFIKHITSENIDVLGIGDEFYRKLPKRSKALLDDFSLEHIDIACSISLKLIKDGAINDAIFPKGGF